MGLHPKGWSPLLKLFQQNILHKFPDLPEKQRIPDVTFVKIFTIDRGKIY